MTNDLNPIFSLRDEVSIASTFMSANRTSNTTSTDQNNASQNKISFVYPPEDGQLVSSSNVNRIDQTQPNLSAVYFLIADFLKRSSPCQRSADLLIQELNSFGLLGNVFDWQGNAHKGNYLDYRSRHQKMSNQQLVNLLSSLTEHHDSQKISSAFAPKKSASLLFTNTFTKPARRLTSEESKDLQKDIVKYMSRLRSVIRSRLSIERLLIKYENLKNLKEMPGSDVKNVQISSQEAVQALSNRIVEIVQQTEPNGRETTSEPTTSVLRNQLLPDSSIIAEADQRSSAIVPLAADTRAMKQLDLLRSEEIKHRGKLVELTSEAKKLHILRRSDRYGRNQHSMIRRREITSGISSRGYPTHDRILPSPYVYSRMRRLKTLSGHLQIPAYCLTYDKKGKYVITGADDRLVKIWSLQTGELKFTLRGHMGNITDLAVNNSSTLLASSSDDKTVRVWELDTGFPIAVLLGHASVVNTVQFHPKKNIVVTASDDGNCFCYKLPEVDPPNKIETKTETAVRLNSQNAYCLSLRPIYSLSHGAIRQTRSCKVLCLAFSRCGNYVVTGGQDGVGRVWDLSGMLNASWEMSFSFPIRDENSATFLVDPLQVVSAQQQRRQQDQLSSLSPMIQPGLLPPLATPQQPPGGPVREQLSQVEDNSELNSALIGPLALPAVETENQQLQQPVLLPPPQVSEQQEAQQNFTQSPIRQATAPQQRVSRSPTIQAPGSRTVLSPQRNGNDAPVLPTTEPIAILNGHKGSITNIFYSNRGNSIATSSIKDGTTRVWRWQKVYKKITQMVLFEDSSQQQEEAYRKLAEIYGLPKARKKKPPAVDSFMWTVNDKCIVSLHSTKPDTEILSADCGQHIKIWDGQTGKLLKTLCAFDKEKQNGHLDAAFAIDVHPLDWRIVVTGGYDGRIFLWDIESGQILNKFVNVDMKLSSSGEILAIYDGGFSPSGDMLCFTDRHGRLLIYGTGSGEQYAATPVEQYFKRDYAVLEPDSQLNVRDQELRRMPHALPSGPLVDATRQEYAHQPSHLLPSAPQQQPLDPRDQVPINQGEGEPKEDEAIGDSKRAARARHYEANRLFRVKQAKESELKWRLSTTLNDECPDEPFQSAVYSSPSMGNTRQSGANGDQTVASLSYRLNGDPVLLSELARWRRLHVANANRPRLGTIGQLRQQRRHASPSLEERDTSILNMDISSDEDDQDEDFRVPNQGNGSGGEDEDDEDDDMEDEEEESEDVLYMSGHESHEELIRQGRRRSQGLSRAGRRLGRGRRLRGGGAAQDDSSDSGLDRRTRRQLRERAPMNDEEDEQMQNTSRVRTRRARYRQRIESSSEDEYEFSSNEEESQQRQRARPGLAATSRTVGRNVSSRSVHGSDDDNNEEEDASSGPVVVETNDGFIMGDNQEDRFDTSLTYAQMLEEKRRQGGANAFITCAFCNEGDVGGMLKLPGEMFGVHPLINGQQRLFVHDQCTIASPLCFHRAGKWYNVTKEIRRGRSLVCTACKTRGATIGCTKPECKATYHWKCALSFGWEMNQLHFYCPQHEHLRSEEEKIAAVSNGAHFDDDEEPVTNRMGLVFHRQWLQQLDLSKKISYVPQVGDYVVYFPRGHMPYLVNFSNSTSKNRIMTTNVNHLMKFHAVKCRILEIKYRFPLVEEFSKCNTIKCELSLAALAVPSACFRLHSSSIDLEETKQEESISIPSDWREASELFDDFQSVDQDLCQAVDDLCDRFRFQVLYHPHDLSNFLVLDHDYTQGIRAAWNIGDRIQMPYVELDPYGFEIGSEMSYGTIVEMNILKRDPWECIKVKFDPDPTTGTSDECDVSPWELELADPHKRLEKKRKESSMLETKLFRIRQLTQHQKNALLNAMDSVMRFPIAQDFIELVDERTFSDYFLTVAHPMSLSIIKRRIETGYYRQIEAFVSDIKLVGENCERYNVETSEIAQNARTVIERILLAVNQHFPLYKQEQDIQLQRIGGDNDDQTQNELESDAQEEEQQQQSLISATRLVYPTTLESIDGYDETAPDPEITLEDVINPAVGLNVPMPPTAPNVASLEVSTTPNQISAVRTRSRSHQEESNEPSTRSSRHVVDEDDDEEEEKKSEISSQPTLKLTRSGRSTALRFTVESSPKRRPISTQNNAAVAMDQPEYISLLTKLTTPQRESFLRLCTSDLKSFLGRIHRLVIAEDSDRIFAQPVTEELVPGYHSVIKCPMDFGTIARNIANGSYHHFVEYLLDLNLVFRNSVEFNGPSHWVSEIGYRIQDNFHRLVTKAFSTKLVILSSDTKGKSKAKAPGRGRPSGNKKNKFISDRNDDGWGGDNQSFSSSSASSISSEESDEAVEEDEDDDVDSFVSDDSEIVRKKRRRPMLRKKSKMGNFKKKKKKTKRQRY